MEVSRRDFLRFSVGAASGTALAGLVGSGVNLGPTVARAQELRIKNAKVTPSVCPYCSVGCGTLIHPLDGHIVNVEGDPRSPHNEGTLCPKGITLKDDITHANRLMKPKVRRPGSDKWEDISWDEAISKIARHIKTTRDKTFVAKNAKGEVVNRNPGMAMIGGCTDTNEFNFLQWKVITALGVPYRDSQARV